MSVIYYTRFIFCSNASILYHVKTALPDTNTVNCATDTKVFSNILIVRKLYLIANNCYTNFGLTMQNFIIN